MATPSEPDTRTSVAELMTGILADAQDLLRQQLALFRLEIQAEIQKAKEAGALLAAGAVIAMVGVLLLCFMAVYLLAWAAPQLPMWACYGLVGAPVIAVGTVLCVAGLRKLNVAGPPSDQALPALNAPAPNLEEKFNG